MEFFQSNSNINFMGQRNKAFFFSILIAILACSTLWIKGLNLGLDFTGGLQIECTIKKDLSLSEFKSYWLKAGFDEARLQSLGSSQHYIVKLPASYQAKWQNKQPALKTSMPWVQWDQVSFIGPQVGKNLLSQAYMALLLSMVCTMIYIAIRFDYRFAISAAISLIHDPILILGVFSWFQMEFDLIVLAALLTIIGYSLNDTIVVYDRIRENFATYQNLSPSEIVNRSINQTLSRTIMTSGLTLLVVIALLLFGGHTLDGFAWALLLGILIGTYSSIYIAGSFSLVLGLSSNVFKPRYTKKQLDAIP
ncbi:protein translocase subunit SecF [Gammaproteobacteria bacterium]|nr:protein translocase subunit SecF [Gammaproteobacteria bacterium]